MFGAKNDNIETLSKCPWRGLVRKFKTTSSGLTNARIVIQDSTTEEIHPIHLRVNINSEIKIIHIYHYYSDNFSTFYNKE